jgi:serine/tyrosine/threonine adenylyltransferase
MQPERTILTLGPEFYDPVRAANFPRLILRYRNQRAAQAIGLDSLSDAQWLEHFGRFQALPGGLEQALALRYHGHQFRSYNPDIGDGRGFLFAQLRDLTDGRLLDLGTKGSGQTPYSRFGDGRLTLKGGVREILATEILEARGVYTSKTFSLIETGEDLTRNDEPSPTRSSVLVRLSHSHIRFGTFQRLAYFEKKSDMERLVDYCLSHLLDLPIGGTLDDRVARFLDTVVARAARLVASYISAGFVHGVLNTDNLNVTGESFDYGPYRFAPNYDLQFTAAYFDQFGLYAFGRQGEAFQWNLYQLAKALLLIVEKEALIPALETFPQRFEDALITTTFNRLGLLPSDIREKNVALLAVLETVLGQTSLPFDQFYHDWYAADIRRVAASPLAEVYASEACLDLRTALQDFEADPKARARLSHGYFQHSQPCGLLIDEIEFIWSRIAEADDWSALTNKMGDAYR